MTPTDSLAKRTTPTAGRSRGGRPPSSRAGEVDARILDAASRLFLARGFEGTSCDQVAVLARAGKASIYARHPSKEALFAAVVRRDAGQGLANAPEVPADRPVGERLVAAGTDLVEQALRPEAVALLRLVVAEGARFPALASHVDRVRRDGSLSRVADAIAGPSTSPDAGERAMAPAMLFIELTLVPLQMRALLGEDPAALRTDAAARVDAAVTMMAASGRLDGWP